MIDWLPHVLLVETMSHLDAISLAKVVAVCQSCADGVDEASEACARTQGLLLPVMAGRPVTWRLRFAERLGRTGAVWEVCEGEPARKAVGRARHENAETDLRIMIFRHTVSGLMLFLEDHSNGWLEVSSRSKTSFLTDCHQNSLEMMDYDRFTEPVDADTYVPLAEYLSRTQPDLTGNFSGQDDAALNERWRTPWAFSVHDGCKVALMNVEHLLETLREDEGEDGAEEETSYTHEVLLKLLGSKRSLRGARLLDEHGVNCFYHDLQLRVRYTADAVESELRRRGVAAA